MRIILRTLNYWCPITVCFNENRFYSSDMPDGAKLYEGTALLVTLPPTDISLPNENRSHPLFFQEAADVWRNSRPEPQDELFIFTPATTVSGRCSPDTGFVTWRSPNSPMTWEGVSARRVRCITGFGVVRAWTLPGL